MLLTECLNAARVNPILAQDICIVSEKSIINEGDMSRKQLAECVRARYKNRVVWEEAVRGATVGRDRIQHCSGKQSVDVDGKSVVHVGRSE